jgi:putative DNA primase/helicase
MMLMGTPGGTLDLRTGNLRPADPSDRITRLTGATPSPTSHSPTFDRFLDNITAGDNEYRRFLKLDGSKNLARRPGF